MSGDFLFFLILQKKIFGLAWRLEGWRLEEPGKTVAAAQLAIADPEKHPEFKGKVKCIEARDLWRELDESPRSQNYHYHRNAGTYMDVGLALGNAMSEILKKK